MSVQLFNGDCLELMKSIPDKSVELVLCDLPYGVTQNKWDTVLPFDKLWEQYLRIGTDNASYVLTGTQPFTSMLVMSNTKMFKYDWTWQKQKGTGHLNCKIQPMKDKEDILVFAKEKPTYNPQMTAGKPFTARGGTVPSENYGNYTSFRNDNLGTRYPKQVIQFRSLASNHRVHPTQKPVDLMEYLINTHSNVGDCVMDNCMGSGSTGVASVRSHRRFIGIEFSQEYFTIAEKRIAEAVKGTAGDEFFQ